MHFFQIVFLHGVIIKPLISVISYPTPFPTRLTDLQVHALTTVLIFIQPVLKHLLCTKFSLPYNQLFMQPSNLSVDPKGHFSVSYL